MNDPLKELHDDIQQAFVRCMDECLSDDKDANDHMRYAVGAISIMEEMHCRSIISVVVGMMKILEEENIHWPGANDKIRNVVDEAKKSFLENLDYNLIQNVRDEGLNNIFDANAELREELERDDSQTLQ